jgi:TonB-dependent SusC/RagA subfamily outer membrane receptor
MKPSIPRFARLRGGLAVTFASVAVLVACQATLPVADNHADSAAKSATTKTNKPPFTGLVFIDGVRVPASRVDSLDRKEIESVEVLKGAAAVTQYGPDAANGVILIKRKPGGGTK